MVSENSENIYGEIFGVHSKFISLQSDFSELDNKFI
jgi:hypothetical protein